MHSDTKFGMIVTTLTIASVFAVLITTTNNAEITCDIVGDHKYCWLKGQPRPANFPTQRAVDINPEPKEPEPIWTDLNVKDLDPKKCENCELTQYDAINQRIYQQKLDCENNGLTFTITKQGNEIIQIACN